MEASRRCGWRSGWFSVLQIPEPGGYKRDNVIYLAFYLTISLCEAQANCEHSRRSSGELVSLEPQRRRAKPSAKTKVSRGSQATGVAGQPVLFGPIWQALCALTAPERLPFGRLEIILASLGRSSVHLFERGQTGHCL